MNDQPEARSPSRAASRLRRAVPVRSVVAGARLQVAGFGRRPGELQFFFVVPLFAIIFLAVLTDSGRTDLRENAVLGAALMGLWGVSLFQSGRVLVVDRAAGIAELVLATPSGAWPMLCGRIGAISLFSLLTFGESWLVAAVLFDDIVLPAHPVIFVLGLVAIVFATAGTSTAIAALFTLGRDTTIARNSLSYPFYLLAGVVVPVSLLPGWVQPLARLCYLSWSGDLLRDTMRAGPVPHVAGRLGAIVLLGIVGFVVGRLSLTVVINRGRTGGTLGFQ